MQTLATTELSATLVAHHLAYSFLGKAFFEAPSVALINTLQEEALFADWPLEDSNEAMHAGLDILQRVCEQWDEANFQDVKRDYGQLFIGPNRLPAPPWESVYRSEEHLMFEEETFQVRALYRQFGMDIPSECIQPDDHFGLEMFFIAHLCRMGLDALAHEQSAVLDSVLQAVNHFLQDHICQWSEQFLADVKAHAATDYYQGLAFLAEGCIAHTVTSWQTVTAIEIKS